MSIDGSIFKAYDVRFFFYIGGNDSADTTHKMHLMAQQMGYELHAIGIPKTVDNDLNRTDHSHFYPRIYTPSGYMPSLLLEVLPGGGAR